MKIQITAPSNGAKVSGKIKWTAAVTGDMSNFKQVEFRVDAVPGTPALWVEKFAPFQFAGDPDGTLDTAKLSNGQHKLGVRCIDKQGRNVSNQVIYVDVENAAVPPPPPPPSGYSGFVGTVSPDLALAKSKGVSQVRIDIGFLEKAEVDAFGPGNVVPIACYNPWSDLRPSGTSDHYPPLSASQQATWAQRQMAQITGKFSSQPAALEVWNEPWLTGFWSSGPNAAAFLSLCKAFAVEAWKVWPTVTILVSADSGWGGWCDKLVAADTDKWLNDPRVQPTVHPYCNNQAPSATPTKDYGFQRYGFTFDAWKAHGHPDPKCWLTEFGWVTDTAGQHYGSEGPAVTEAVQAQYMVDAYRIAHDSGKVAKAYAYMLSPNQTWSYNWLRADNSDKPVVAAVKQLVG